MKGLLDFAGRNSIIKRTVASCYTLTSKTDDVCDGHHRHPQVSGESWAIAASAALSLIHITSRLT